jgi:5-methylcytosine-specific restriction enzyme subunit McrC
MKIPVRNLYYLLCYAWDRLEEGDVVAAEQEGATELVDLFARVLEGGVPTHHATRPSPAFVGGST